MGITRLTYFALIVSRPLSTKFTHYLIRFDPCSTNYPLVWHVYYFPRNFGYVQWTFNYIHHQAFTFDEGVPP